MVFSKESKILTVVFFVNIIFWIFLNVSTKHTAATEGFLFEYILKIFHFSGDVMFLLGGVFGLLKAIKWGGIKSAMGSAVLFISLGLISWSVGGFTWFWYLFFAHVELPYPSLVDVGFLIAIPLWSYGAICLSKATGARIALRNIQGKIMRLLFPVLTAFFSYYLLIVVARKGSIDFSVTQTQLFFDLAYPLGDVVIFTVVGMIYLLSRKFLGGRYAKTILTLFFGFICMYIADFLFSYTVNVETYFNGNFVDVLFVLALFLVSVSISNLDPNLYD